MPNPVSYIEGDEIHVLIDPFEDKQNGGSLELIATYIKKPAKFAFSYKEDATYDFKETTEFELSDTMAEELINLTIAMALENVESTRLGTKLQTRQLEA